MTTDISNIVTVNISLEGATAQRDNMNVVAIITKEQGFLSSTNRYAIYKNVQDVALNFGTSSQAYQYATAFFGTQPNPISAGGYLVMGYWRGESETVPATSGKLVGAPLDLNSLIPQLQLISKGQFHLAYGTTPTEKDVTDLDFSTVTDLNDVVTIINAKLTADTVPVTFSIQGGNRLVVTDNATGTTSAVDFLTAVGVAVGTTNIHELLGLAQGTGAVKTDGAAAATLTPETKVEAITQLKSLVNIKGAMFIDSSDDATVNNLALWAQANNVLIYDVFNDPAVLTISDTNPVWLIKVSSLTRYRCLYSKAGNRKFAAAYMARVHTVNFNASNSAQTIQFKELAIAAEDYNQTELNNAQKVGLDIYTLTKDVPYVFASGANDFVDNVYNIMAYTDALQTDVFNLFKTTAKIPQTTPGVNQLLDQCIKTTVGFVNAGVFAPGTWSNASFFGDRETFLNSIKNSGFYFMAGLLSEQSQADRAARKAPPIQGAVKNAGAIHSADIIVLFNI